MTRSEFLMNNKSILEGHSRAITYELINEEWVDLCFFDQVMEFVYLQSIKNGGV